MVLVCKYLQEFASEIFVVWPGTSLGFISTQIDLHLWHQNRRQRIKERVGWFQNVKSLIQSVLNYVDFLNSQDIDMVQFTTARLREYGKDWELSRMWLCDVDYMIMASNEFDLNSLNLHLVCPAEHGIQPVAIGGGFAGLEPANPDHQSHYRVWTSRESSNWNSQFFCKTFGTHFSGHEDLILPLFSLVVLFGFRCSASDTRDCGDILVRHLVKASLWHTWYTRDIEPVAAWCWWCRKISWAMSLGLWRTSRHPCMIHVSFPTQWRLDQGVRSKRLRKVLHVLLLFASQHFSKRCGSWWCFWWRGFMRGPLQVNSNLKIFCFRNSLIFRYDQGAFQAEVSA